MTNNREPGGQGFSTEPAESVLDLRQRLWQVLRRSADMGARAGIDEEKQIGLFRLAEAAREPFLLVIAGEVNSGKSTFVNAFFREEVTLSDVLPTTETVLWFRHGEPSDEPWQDDLIIRRRPAPFLRDFHVVDTPGTNSIVIGHDAATERFLPMADLVVLVLPITNPWSASAWGFLDRLLHQWRKRVVIVLQQADLLEPRAVATVSGHVRGRLHAAFGEVMPVFAVSAKLALSAHGAADAEQQRALWESSGFSAVETYLRQRVGRHESRLIKMLNTVEAGLSILRQISVQISPEGADSHMSSSLPTQADAEEKLVQEIDERIDSEERFALSALPTVVEPLVQCWRELEVLLPGQIEERLGIFSTFRALLFGERTSRLVGQKLRASMGMAGEQCHTGLTASLRERGERLWDALLSHLANAYDFPLRLDTPNGRPDFAQWAAIATMNVPGRIAETVVGCPMESSLACRLFTRTAILRGLLLLVAALGAAGWWAWSASLPMPSLAAAAVAVFSCLVVTVGVARQGVAPIVEESGRELESHRARVAESAGEAAELATREFFLRVGRVFDPVRMLRLGGPDATGAALGAIRRELESIAATINKWTTPEGGANSGLSGAQGRLD